MHINCFALNPHVDALIHFLEETPAEFNTEVKGLSSNEIKPLHF